MLKTNKCNNVSSSVAFDTISSRHSFDNRDDIQLFSQKRFIEGTENLYKTGNLCTRVLLISS